MNKKILALALAIVFIATAFTACKQEYEMMKIGGKEYPVYRDDEGELVINDRNEAAVLVTDENNEIITYENGEDQTRWVPLVNDYVNDDFVQGKNFKLSIPDGWEGTGFGKVTKKNTDNKCYIEFKQLRKLKTGETIEGLLKVQDENDMLVGEALKDEAKMQEIIKQNPLQAEAIKALIGSTYTLDKKTASITKDSIRCDVRIHKIVNSSGTVVQYIENYYFVSKDTVYQLNYVCLEGKGYDESFNFAQYISDGFTFRVA